jgi:large subunit ribosomal protein L6
MKLISNKYILKIPSELNVLYCSKRNSLLIKSKQRHKLLKLKLKIIILKEKNFLFVTNLYAKKQSNSVKKTLDSLRGTTLSLIKKSFSEVLFVNCKKLKLVGVGYKVLVAENKKFLQLKLGYSHNLYYKIPKTIKLEVRQSTKIFIFGYDFLNVCDIASVIRNFKKPEPYKGKGILYFDEKILLKEGKKV